MERRVAVIGAGAAGLVSARELIRADQTVVVFEKAGGIGGTWLYDESSSGHSSVYKSLRTNLPRESMGFLDHPFLAAAAKDPRRFPGHEEVLSYLRTFADRFDLMRHVRLSTNVTHVGHSEGDNSGHWIVESISSISNTGVKVKEVFEAVVVCNGHYFQPRLAQIPGIERWPGKQCHSHNYRTPHAFKDKVVAVIGNGPSGQDISSDIADCCRHVHWCAKSWDDSAQRGNVSKHLMIDMADEDGTLHFKDGASAVVDVILHCTGYLYDFPFLDTGDYMTVEDNRVGPLFKHVFPPALAPSLSFVGLPWKILPFPVFELQAKWIAAVLKGSVALPSVKGMEEDINEFYALMGGQGVPQRYTHSLDVQMFDYANWLARVSNSRGGVEKWREQLYLNTRENKKLNPERYRDEWNDEDLYKTVIELLV